MTPAEIEWINGLRRAEMSALLQRLPWLAGDLLEIGGGTGQQAAILAAAGLNVTAIDLPSSGYREARQFPIREYDGKHIPFPDGSFDVVFSSSTLEHIPDLESFEGEIARVLRPKGRAVHVLPTHHWRLWTSLAHYPAVILYIWRRLKAAAPPPGGVAGEAETVRRPSWWKALFPPRHGERGNALTEWGYFHPRWWSAHFERTGWRIRESFPMGLLYTGYMIANGRLPLATRRSLARIFGSATRCFVLEKRGNE